MFKLFKRKNKIKEFESKAKLDGCTFVGADITHSEIDQFLNKYFTQLEKDKENKNTVNVDYIEVFKSASGSLRIDKSLSNKKKITIKINSFEGNETTVTIDNECIKLSVNKAELKEKVETNDLILQIDSEVIGKAALDQLKKCKDKVELH